MRHTGWMAGLLCLAGCVTTGEERLREFNEDGVFLFRRGQYAAARDTFQAALALSPEDPALIYNIGQCCDHLGRPAQAEAAYQDCLQRAPNHPQCRQALAGLLVRRGQRDEARRMVTAWLAREPNLAGPYALDGWLWHEAGDLPRAQARLQQALEIDPNHGPALTELALIYEALQRPDRALVLYERALAKDPGQPEVKQRVQFLLTKGAARPQPEN